MADFEEVDVKIGNEILTVRVPKGLPDAEIRRQLSAMPPDALAAQPTSPTAPPPSAGPTFAGRLLRAIAPMGATPAAEVRGRGIAPTPTIQSSESAAGEEQAGRRMAALEYRTLPVMFSGNPLVQAPLAGGGEIAAQLVEGQPQINKGQVALATATPLALAGAVRGARAVGRSVTRLMPTRFAGAQAEATEAAGEMVQGLRPPAGQVAEAARLARESGGDLIPARNVMRTIENIVLPETPANPRLDAVKTTIDNLRSKITPLTVATGGAPRVTAAIDLQSLEAIRRDIGPLLQSRGAPAELRSLYGAIVNDLEAASSAGGVGATAARQVAAAFKRDLGASRVAELVEKATTRRVISGSDVPALNVATLAKLTRTAETRRQLTAQIGPEGLRVVDDFVQRFRSLPPDVAYNAWGRLVTTIGGLGGGAYLGGAVGGIPGAIVGAITPELLANMAVVGANPRLLNQVMSSVARGIEAGPSVVESER